MVWEVFSGSVTNGEDVSSLLEDEGGDGDELDGRPADKPVCYS